VLPKVERRVMPTDDAGSCRAIMTASVSCLARLRCLDIGWGSDALCWPSSISILDGKCGTRRLFQNGSPMCILHVVLHPGGGVPLKASTCDVDMHGLVLVGQLRAVPEAGPSLKNLRAPGRRHSALPSVFHPEARRPLFPPPFPQALLRLDCRFTSLPLQVSHIPRVWYCHHLAAAQHPQQQP